MSNESTLTHIFDLLLAAYGPQQWWPAETPFEVMVGAILTQNTSWTGVERAVTSLKELDALSPEKLLAVELHELEQAVRPSGYFRQKAGRLKTLSRFVLDEYGGDPALMERTSIHKLRQQFMALKGVGPETADSILLYALDRPAFVIDAYTVRLFSRLGLCEEQVKYHDLQKLFMNNLEPDVPLFNEYHALVVRHGKERCRKRSPLCEGCVLGAECFFNDSVAILADSC